ncbi:hypothetical protein HF325_005685 [Metschnikowia pulcherrima]|uniref:FAD-binding FR-type domain-containing protein n=1 Tax=Metschnikowia pulcherrima TaxID=27326 RepID=A0A8H7GNN5_9ASCO|nr:hypothetical protein HF325_005685 [Metschnikowia pulcherrima]
MDNGIAKLMKKNVKPYIPKLNHQRLTYEYPGLPNEDDFTKHTDKIKKPKKISRWALVTPKLAVFAAVIWGAYVVKVWVYASDDDADSTELLDPDIFHKFVITHKHQIDADHYLIEVRPKYNNWQYSYYAHYDNKSIWNGEKMWSVEVKQPEIMVTRLYTPLPLYFMKSEITRAGKKEPLLRVIENDCEDHDKGGVMTFYIKRYDSGEVSRFIVDKNVGDELEIRGPHVDFKIPHHPLHALHERPIFRDLPSKVEAETLLESMKREHNVPDYDNLVFFGAGTGLPQSYRCFSPETRIVGGYRRRKVEIANVDLRRSEEKKEKEEKPGSSPIRGPWYENALQQARDLSLEKKQDPALAVVCGPDGYVGFVAGGKDLATGEQGPVKGLLGANGWNETNVHKL